MAIGTAITGFAHGCERAAMAASAGDLYMRTVYLEISLYIMIEQPEIPGDRVMAGFAITLKDAIVIVVLEMTVDTGIAGISKALRLVAFVAFDVAVLTQQWEGRQVMLEERRIFPIGLCVTVAALFTELAGMRVIIEVARHTVVAGCRLENGLDMAVITGNCLVCTIEREFRRNVVIKKRLVPGLAGMAKATVGAAMAGVTVVLQMTTGAGHIHIVIKRVFAVAVSTGQVCVFALQRKIGVAGVVEACVRP